jgi:hypothetical protein
MDDIAIWGKRYNKGFCVIDNPEGFKDQFLLMKGVQILSQWPENIVCRMSDEYPKDIQLSDNLCGGNYQVISQGLKEKLAAVAGSGHIEFLPVTILNHKGRVASKDYFVLNPVGSVECIDVEKSGVVWNAIDESDISRMKQLVLRDGAIPAAVSIFRAQHLLSTILIRRALANQLSSDGFTGLYFRDPARFRG